MPLQFLEQVFAALRRGGVVRSRRRAGGEYSLARPAAEITGLDVVAALTGGVPRLGQRPVSAGDFAGSAARTQAP